jgi:hypothetical protein
VEIVAEWQSAPMWHPSVVYPSTELELPQLYTDKDDARSGPRLLGAATKRNLLHPIQGDYFESATWFQPLSSSKKHEKQDGA